MLILTRKKDESIVINGVIIITIIEIRGGRVRLGIEAPRAMAIRRGELSPDASSDDSETETFEVEGTVQPDGTVVLDEDIEIRTA